MEAIDVGGMRRVPWNKGKLTGQKPPLKMICGTRYRGRSFDRAPMGDQAGENVYQGVRPVEIPVSRFGQMRAEKDTHPSAAEQFYSLVM